MAWEIGSLGKPSLTNEEQEGRLGTETAGNEFQLFRGAPTPACGSADHVLMRGRYVGITSNKFSDHDDPDGLRGGVSGIGPPVMLL